MTARLRTDSPEGANIGKFLFFLCLVAAGLAQPVIGYNPALYATGVVYTTRTVEEVTWDYGSPGHDTWNITGYSTGVDQEFEVVPYSPSLPDVDLCMMVPNYIVYYFGTTETSETEGWGYFHVNSARQLSLGLTGTLESGTSTYTLTAFNTSATPGLEFPTEYGDEWSEISQGEGDIGAFGMTINYDVWDTITNVVDGWGTIVTDLGTFDCLRIKKRTAKHSHSDNIFFGFDKWERQVKYTFLTYELGPVATFSGPKDTLGGQPDSTFTVGKLDYQLNNTMLNIAEKNMPDMLCIAVSPNPFNGSTHIDIPDDAVAEIYDVQGHLVDRFNGSRVWNPPDCSGTYLLRVNRNGSIGQERIVYIK